MGYEKGQVLDGRYEVQDLLGQGGMGDTYRACDRLNGSIVVLKIPHASLIGDPATYGRYERETEIGKRLNHPHIQRLLAVGKLRGIAPYLVLEYVEGEPFREFLSTRAPLPSDQAVDLTIQIADALAYCHSLGIVHRDMKPENALIARDGQIKLVDFGIALLRGARRLTFRRFSSEVGTPDYMAPEQVQGERGDARTDVYAVGVMLYEMLAGRVPYAGDNALAIMSQHVNADAPLLRLRRPDAPPGLEAIVFRALRREPQDRYQSMADLKSDLEHPERVVIPDYPKQVAYSATRAAWRTALPTVALVAGVLLVLALIAIAAELIHRAQVSP